MKACRRSEYGTHEEIEANRQSHRHDIERALSPFRRLSEYSPFQHTFGASEAHETSQASREQLLAWFLEKQNGPKDWCMILLARIFMHLQINAHACCGFNDTLVPLSR
jgi:hypothetical protein